MSMSSTIKKDTAEKNVGTDDLLPISRSLTNRPATNDIGQARSALGNQPKQEGPIPENRKKKSKMKGTRPTAVVFNKEGLTYAEMLKKIRQDTNIRSEGHKIDAVSRTTSGKLRIVLRRNAENTDDLTKAISQAIGDGTTIKTLADRSQIEIHDIDEEATDEEIRQAVMSAVGVQVNPAVLRVRNLAKRGTKTAIVVVPSSLVAKLTSKRLRIGYVNCRVRRMAEIIKCYKCQNFGHTRSSCDGPERSKLCWRCGKEGHRNRDCGNPPKCALCEGAGEKDDHVLGSYRCLSY